MNDYQPNLKNSSESYSKPDGDYIPKIVEWSETYVQDEDCMQDDAATQELHLRAVDGGGGPFIVIKTDRWALDADHIDEFAAQLKKFIERNNSTRNK